MTQVAHIRQLSEHVQPFTGETEYASIKAAEAWGAAHGVTMEKYYLQKFDGRSIIADYKE